VNEYASFALDNTASELLRYWRCPKAVCTNPDVCTMSSPHFNIIKS